MLISAILHFLLFPSDSGTINNYAVFSYTSPLASIMQNLLKWRTNYQIIVTEAHQPTTDGSVGAINPEVGPCHGISNQRMREQGLQDGAKSEVCMMIRSSIVDPVARRRQAASCTIRYKTFWNFLPPEISHIPVPEAIILSQIIQDGIPFIWNVFIFADFKGAAEIGLLINLDKLAKDKTNLM